MSYNNWSSCGAEDGREQDRLDLECFAEHARMVPGNVCATCGYAAPHDPECECRVCIEENRNEADFDEWEKDV